MNEFICGQKYIIKSKYGALKQWEGTFTHFGVYYGEFESDIEEFPIFFTPDNVKKEASFENDTFYSI
jgi:hypothetical protein